MSTRQRYLAEVADRLPLGEPQRSEVLEELAAHLGDGVADLIAQGREVDEAESEVLRRLGPPDELATGLMRARQTRGQLLAAAGAGAMAALRSGILGALAGWLLVALASMLATVALQYLRPMLELPSWSGWTPGWNGVITGAGLAIGAALGGAAGVRVVAARAWRRPVDVRAAVAIVGAAAIGYLTLVSAKESLNWASVLAYLAIPAAFVVGARFERLRPPSRRRVLAATTVLLLGAVAVGAGGGFASRGGGAYEWTDATHGYAMIAPRWAEPGSSNSAIVSSESGSGTLGIESVTVGATSAAALSTFNDFRLEAWRADAPQDGWALVPGQTAPFATSMAIRDGASVSGTIAFNEEPGVDWAEIVLTAVGPDGRRFLLWASGPRQSEFYGSVASWFAALAR